MQQKLIYKISVYYYLRMLLFFVMLTQYSFNACAQNYKEDVSKIRSEYENKYHSFTIQYHYYPYDSVKKITDSLWGQCYHNGELFYCKIHSISGLMEYMKNKKYYVEINHPGKAILIHKSSATGQELWNMNKLDSLLMLPSVKVVYKSTPGNKGEYEITYDKGLWNHVRIVFDKEKYTLDEVWLYSVGKGKIYGQPYNKPKIGIFYKNYNQEIPSDKLFYDLMYFRETDTGFTLTNELKGFRIMDYFHTKQS
jgi:hypothetical protein